MADIRRILIIFVIAALFTILVNVSIDAFYQEPQYDRYCNTQPYPTMPYKEPPTRCEDVGVSQNTIDSCTAKKGTIQYKYDEKGCVKDAYCDTCNLALEDAQRKYNLIVFIVSAFAGLIALTLGFNLPKKKNIINEWVGSGFLLGGISTIFVGTIRYFGDLGRYYRPIVILIELALVIFLAYKKLGKKMN